jgi:hypothetical protein
MHLLVIDHPDSLETIERDGQIVKVLGKGIMKSPGHPAGNQQYYTQMELLSAATIKPYLFPIYNKDSIGRIEYLGQYKLLWFRIRMSFEGFRYYEYTMMRVVRSTPGVETVFPPELVQMKVSV